MKKVRMTFAEHAADELGSRRLKEQTDGEREVAGNRDARHKKCFCLLLRSPEDWAGGHQVHLGQDGVAPD